MRICSQIHTTGMDIKHVVNATAVITLGKDMTFRDYVQGAYRMRGIGSGQKIHVYIIPEVADLISREIRAANSSDSLASTAIFETTTRLSGGEGRDTASLASDELQEAEKRSGGLAGHGPLPCDTFVVHSSDQGLAEVEKVLEALVAWLVINSMRTEQTQWSMLCVQNASNIYRKNAFRRILSGAEPFCTGEFKEADRDAPSTDASRDEAVGGEKDVETLPLLPSLKVFDEAIDFSLEAAVPDPIPFADKLRHLLTSHFEFIVSEEQHKIGHQLMTEVNEFTCASESNGDDGANLDTQQEREMEQEQEKEVKARRDQQIEVEKFVEREYSRHQERPTPWSSFSPPVSTVVCPSPRCLPLRAITHRMACRPLPVVTGPVSGLCLMMYSTFSTV